MRRRRRKGTDENCERRNCFFLFILFVCSLFCGVDGFLQRFSSSCSATCSLLLKCRRFFFVYVCTQGTYTQTQILISDRRKLALTNIKGNEDDFSGICCLGCSGTFHTLLHCHFDSFVFGVITFFHFLCCSIFRRQKLSDFCLVMAFVMYIVCKQLSWKRK